MNMLAPRATLLTLAAIAIFASHANAAWNQTTFQIGGYVRHEGPIDATRLIRINDAGMDWYMHFGSATTQAGAARIAAVTDSLRLNRSGFVMRDIVTYGSGDPLASPPDVGAGRLYYNVDQPIDYNAIATSIAPSTGMNNTSVLGWAVWDEPCDTLSFGNVGRLSRFIATQPSGNDRLPYVNLFPSYTYDNDSALVYRARFGVGAGLSKEAGYREYLRAYLSLFDSSPNPAPLISFDSYPFQFPDTPARDYFLNLRVARDMAAEYSRPGQRIPFWVVVQLSAFRAPAQPSFPANFSFANTRWQVYSALAYGAKGISYWGMTPYQGATEVWGAGALDSAGNTNPAIYPQLVSLNQELHKLGPTLMKLDPVASFHGDWLGWEGSADELFTSDERLYNILASVGASSSDLLVGHLKDRANGDDYLMVVNKSLTSVRSFSLTLSNPADSLLRIDRSSGSGVLVGTNTSTLAVNNLSPGQGELFRILDQTYEYIPNVSVMAVAGARQYFGHYRGIVMVDRSTGRRTQRKDGDVFTPISDLAVSASHVFACQDHGGPIGSVIRTNPDLSGAILFATMTGRPKAITVQAAESSIVVVDRLSTTTSAVRVFDSGGTQLTAINFNDGAGPAPYSSPYVAYDVQYQEGLGSFSVAHGRFYSRYLAKAPFTRLNNARYRTQTPSNVRLAAVGSGTSQLLFAGRNEGTIGGVEKMSYDLVRPAINGWWPASATQPSVKDVAASGNHVLFGSTSPGGDFFVRLRGIDLWALGYRSTTAPTAVALTPDSTALMANALGVARSSLSGLAGRYNATPAHAAAFDSLQSVPLALSLTVSPNPVVGELSVRLALPRQGTIDLAVFDVAGRLVARIARGEYSAGIHQLTWVAGSKMKGGYFVRVRTADGTLSRKVTVR